MFLTWRAPMLVVLGIGAVLLRPAMSTTAGWVALCIVAMVIDWWLAPRPSQLQLQRSGGTRTRPDTVLPTSLLISNTGRRRVRGWLRDAWQPSAGARGNRHPLDLPASTSHQVATTLVPMRRGMLRTDRVTVRTLGPLGLAGRQASSECTGRIRVWPAFPSMRHLPSRVARLRELDGRAALRIRGAGTEFDSLREYVRGDDVRSIDWRATARSAKVVVRTWRPERDRRIVVLIDSGRTSAARIGEVPRLDSELDAVLLLAALAQRAGDRVDVVAGDRVERVVLKGTHQADAFARLQDELSAIQPQLVETNWHRLTSAALQLGRQRSLMVLVTPIDPAVVLHSLVPALGSIARRHHVVIASVSDPELTEMAKTRTDTAATYAAAAAETAAQQRRDTIQVLNTLGVEVIDADSATLPPALADRYLALKAAGKL